MCPLLNNVSVFIFIGYYVQCRMITIYTNHANIFRYVSKDKEKLICLYNPLLLHCTLILDKEKTNSISLIMSLGGICNLFQHKIQSTYFFNNCLILRPYKIQVYLYDSIGRKLKMHKNSDYFTKTYLV